MPAILSRCRSLPARSRPCPVELPGRASHGCAARFVELPLLGQYFTAAPGTAARSITRRSTRRATASWRTRRGCGSLHHEDHAPCRCRRSCRCCRGAVSRGPGGASAPAMRAGVRARALGGPYSAMDGRAGTSTSTSRARCSFGTAAAASPSAMNLGLARHRKPARRREKLRPVSSPSRPPDRSATNVRDRITRAVYGANSWLVMACCRDQPGGAVYFDWSVHDTSGDLILATL